jgi:cbb3-type cytochrome oxidase subunit 3
MKGVKDLAEGLISKGSDLGNLSSLGLVFLFLTMLGIYWWTFRPGTRESHEKIARITVD